MCLDPRISERGSSPLGAVAVARPHPFWNFNRRRPRAECWRGSLLRTWKQRCASRSVSGVRRRGSVRGGEGGGGGGPGAAPHQKLEIVGVVLWWELFFVLFVQGCVVYGEVFLRV